MAKLRRQHGAGWNTRADRGETMGEPDSMSA